MQSTQLTPRLPRTSVRQSSSSCDGPLTAGTTIKNPNNIAISRIPHQVQHLLVPHINGTQKGGNQIVPTKNKPSPQGQNGQAYLSQASLANGGGFENRPKETELSQQIDESKDEERNRFLTFSKDQASSHVKSLKEELFSNQRVQDQSRSSNKIKYHSKTSATAKAIEQKFKKIHSDQQRKQQQSSQQKQQERYFISVEGQANGPLQESCDTISDKNSSPKGSQTSSPNIGQTIVKPKPQERLSKLPQQHLFRLFPSPRNSVQHKQSNPEFASLSTDEGGEQTQPTKSETAVLNNFKFNFSNNNNNNSLCRAQPVCEAFIMTGQSMMKLSTNEEDRPVSTSCQTATSTSSGLHNDDLAQERRGKSVSLNKLDVNHARQLASNELKNGGSDRSVDTGGNVVDLSSCITNKAESDKDPGQPESEISVRRRAFFTGTGPPISSDGQRRQSHELASHLWAQLHQGSAPKQQQQQQQQQQRTGAEHEASCNQHALADNVAHEIGNNEVGDRRSEQEQKQQHQHQLRQRYQQPNIAGQPIVINKQIYSMSPYQTHQMLDTTSNIMDKNHTDNKPEGELDNNGSMSITIQSNLTQEEVDRDSARRLAKRLYNLSGFKRSDVCHHLAKSNPFSHMVAEEYLQLFDFRSVKFDAALRKFLSKLLLNGETQERERVLSQFSQRYYECNRDKFPTADAVQTLVCAVILLNTDLHGNHPDRKASKKCGSNKRAKLSLAAWIDGLNSSLKAQCGNGQSANLASQFITSSPGNLSQSFVNESNSSADANYSFPRHLLVDLYDSIKKRPLKCGEDKCEMISFEAELDRIYSQQFGAANNNRSNTLPTRRFAPGSNAPSSTMSASSRRQLKQGLNRLNGCNDAHGGGDGDFSIEFKSGFLFRKRIFEAQGKATPKGRRSWQRVYAILQDLRLIMRYNYELTTIQPNDGSNKSKNELANGKSAKKQQAMAKQREKQMVAQDMKNTLRLHHSMAKRSTTYTKREYVFHLRLADQSELLLQATSENEMDFWIDTINFASACLSSPALPSAVSNSKRYQLRQPRPILPASYTKLSYWEQLIDHEERLRRFKLELDEHINEAPQTRNADKQAKSDFIEKIAFLKQEIERYEIYVELMRKKSNSPEAIILSKHPQIASLTPSEEMMKVLPSFVPSRKFDESVENNEEKAEGASAIKTSS